VVAAAAPAFAPGEGVIGPQAGFQERFLGSHADITIGGGAAGCGKTYAETLAGARHMDVPGFSAVFFRRTTTQIRNPGGLWDEATKVYPRLGAEPNKTALEWTWPSGAKVKMAHLEHEDTINDWHGAQVPLFIFDELTHFTAKQFWYMLSRNRSACGVRPYIMASCNPDAESWVAELIAWWIDQDEKTPDGRPNPNYGYPIPERAGVLRYFTRINEEFIWGDTREDVCAVPSVRSTIEAAAATMEMPFEAAAEHLVKSLTFVPGKLEENKILEKADPGYRGNLMAQDRVTQARLLKGNWKAKPTSGAYFSRHEVTMLEVVPTDVVMWIRWWDLASTEPNESNKDPDTTAGVLMGRRKSGRFVVADAIIEQKGPDDVRALVKRASTNDGSKVRIGINKDPGQAGKSQAVSYVKMLAGRRVTTERETGDPVTRVEPFSSQWQHGNVDVVKGPWNERYFRQMEAFPSKNVHDDAPIASGMAFAKLERSVNMFDVL